MAEIINLRLARKRKARTDKEVRAAQNRIAFGRSRDDRNLTETQRDLAARRLDGHKRDDDSDA